MNYITHTNQLSKNMYYIILLLQTFENWHQLMQ